MSLWQSLRAGLAGADVPEPNQESVDSEVAEFFAASGISEEELGEVFGAIHFSFQDVFNRYIDPSVVARMFFMVAMLTWQAYEESRLRPALEGIKDESTRPD